MVVGEDGTNGSVWCSPVAKTSSPTSSAFLAIVTIALILACSVGTRPFVGAGVTSPTVKLPNCMTAPELTVEARGPRTVPHNAFDASTISQSSIVWDGAGHSGNHRAGTL